MRYFFYIFSIYFVFKKRSAKRRVRNFFSVSFRDRPADKSHKRDFYRQHSNNAPPHGLRAGTVTVCTG